MQLKTIQRILGQLLMLFSVSMLPPLAVSLWFSDGAHYAFVDAFMLILGVGAVLWLPVRRWQRELRLRDGFLIVVMFWVVLSLTGAVPLILAEQPTMTTTNAVFESVSGLTTTGATVLTGLDALPESILFYRQLLQWLGGMGIVVLAVAVLPMLGIGGMQLYRAETPGPIKDTKLTPRITETAKWLWRVYLGLTLACAAAYWACGMGEFDALLHSFSTVSIGGFSSHDASMGYFDNPLIEGVAVLFMGIAGLNFALHFRTISNWRAPSLRHYLADSEARTYVMLLGSVALVTSIYLYVSGTYANAFDAIRNGVFQSVSIGTTTGFTTAGYHGWPSFLPVLLLFSSFVGGCAGSTGGGLKVIRVLLLFKQGMREIVRLIHPAAQVPIKVGGSVTQYRVVDAVWGFFATYVATFAYILLALMATGLDQVTAFSAVAAAMNNLGPGLGDVAAHYGDISALAKWILCVAMLLGRLEIFTLLVVLSPAFWRS